jgi:hypothetical protein
LSRKTGWGARAVADETSTIWKRLAWFVVLWTASVAVLGAVAYALRWWLHP